MGLLAKLKSIFTRAAWNDLTQEALSDKKFLVEPFLSKLHEIEKSEAAMMQERMRQPQYQNMGRAPQQYGSPYGASPYGSSPYGSQSYDPMSMMTKTMQTKEEEKEKEKRRAYANASLAELMNAVRQQQQAN